MCGDNSQTLTITPFLPPSFRSVFKHSLSWDYRKPAHKCFLQWAASRAQQLWTGSKFQESYVALRAHCSPCTLTFSATPTEGLCPHVYQDSHQDWGALSLLPGSSPGESSSAAWGRLWTNCPDGVVVIMWLSCDPNLWLGCLVLFLSLIVFSMSLSQFLCFLQHTLNQVTLRYYPFVISCKTFSLYVRVSQMVGFKECVSCNGVQSVAETMCVFPGGGEDWESRLKERWQ